MIVYAEAITNRPMYATIFGFEAMMLPTLWNTITGIPGAVILDANNFETDEALTAEMHGHYKVGTTVIILVSLYNKAFRSPRLDEGGSDDTAPTKGRVEVLMLMSQDMLDLGFGITGTPHQVHCGLMTDEEDGAETRDMITDFVRMRVQAGCFGSVPISEVYESTGETNGYTPDDGWGDLEKGNTDE